MTSILVGLVYGAILLWWVWMEIVTRLSANTATGLYGFLAYQANSSHLSEVRRWAVGATLLLATVMYLQS